MSVNQMNVGSKFISKKPHACGGAEWELRAAGADYKLKCVKCGRLIIVDYDKANKMIKHIL